MMTAQIDQIRDPSERVRALCQYGCGVDVDLAVPARRYFRSGLEMVRMANVYYAEGDLEKAFILYSKFLTLFVEKLPKHPDYKMVSAADKKSNKKKLPEVMSKAEELKKKLKEKYIVEEEHRRELEKLQEAQEEARRKQEEDDHKMALAIQNEEEQRRHDEAAARIREEQEATYRLLQEEELRRVKDQQEQDEAAAAAGISGTVIADDTTAPPLVQPGEIPPHPPPAYSSINDHKVPAPGAVPVLPNVPSRDLKPVIPSAPPDLTPSSAPTIDRSSKPDHFTSTGGTTHNKYGLRNVVVPEEIAEKFLNIAQSNTSQNKETGGILCGKLAKDAFCITHLLIPKQTGTPDSFETAKEEEVFSFQDEHDLLTLGWIHTHPTQTAFLSSVDLHNHFYYQQMMPEAVAIVCSPKYNETGYFMLTPDLGLDYIRNCKGKGFHKHPNDSELFEECPHIVIDKSATLSVTDLRT